jgi:hypothetical protein
MTNGAAVALWRPPGDLRQELVEMKAGMLDRMRQRDSVEPAHLP